MTQAPVARAVARATGETLAIVRRLGFVPAGHATSARPYVRRAAGPPAHRCEARRVPPR
jgi:hypothetical protein